MGTDAIQLVESSGGGRKVFAVEGFAPDELRRLIADPLAPFSHTDAVVVKSGRSAKLVRTPISFRGQSIEVAWKRTQPRDWWRNLKERFRTPRPLRSWRIGRRFVEAGIPTARPLLAIVPSHPFQPRICFVATEWIAGGRKLDDFVRDLAHRPRDEYRALAEALGRQVGHLHTAGFSHRDLKEENLIIARRGDELRVHIIDLDGVMRYRRVPWRRRMRDISRLLASAVVLNAFQRSDFRRFLRSYGESFDQSRDDWKTCWRWVQRDGRRRLRIKAKKHRGVMFPAVAVLPLEKAA